MNAGDTSGFETFGEDFVKFVGTAFGTREDNDLTGFFPSEDADEEWEFAIFVDGDVELFDGINDNAIFREVDGLGFDHVFLGEPEDVGGHGGGEEECLSVCGTVSEDAFDIGTEADIEHPVCFVEDSDGEIFEVEMSTAHEIDDSTGCSDDDLSAGLDIVDLASGGSTTDCECEADGASSGKSAGFEADLFAEFAGGCENEHLNFRHTAIDLFERGQHEGCSFSGAGACLSDAVAAGECERDECCLDGAGVLVADLQESAECGR